MLMTVLALLCTACGTTQPADVHDFGPAPDPVQDGPPPAISHLWSELDGGTPQAGADVTIPAGHTVLLDVSPPALGHLLIDGVLVFDEQDLDLTADSITVRGAFYIGSSGTEFTNRATITLTGERQAATEEGMGHRYLGTMAGGRLEIHGLSSPSWTRLAVDAHPGDSGITVADAEGWRVGDRIAVATTDYPQIELDGQLYRERQTEERVITGISGSRLELDRPLDFFHVGELMHVAGRAVDQRAEVARLSRNIVIQGPGSVLDPDAADYGFGGHVMVMPGGTGRFTGVEFRRMGQRGILARYPVHYHLLRDGGRGSYVRHSAVHESFNRCVTIHGTNHVQVRDVVGFNSQGHCFFLEDGAETGNVLEGNLALSPMKPQPGFAILTSDDEEHLGPSGFWVTHPDNVLVGNHAVGSDGTGFWYALPDNPTGDYRLAFPDLAAGISPRTAPLGEFRDNTAHSNSSVGLHVDNGPTADLSATPPTWYQPRDLNSEPVTAVFDNLNAWRNRDAGAWFRGDHAVLLGGMLSDNPIGVTFASSASRAEGVTFIGQTPNPGTPHPWDPGADQGISIGRPWDPEFIVRGFEFYDGDVGVTDSFFAAYSLTSFPRAAALSYKDYTAFGVSPLNYSAGLTFAADTTRLYIEDDVPEGYPSDGYRSALFSDLDGSLTGTAGAVVTVDNPFLWAEGCELNAAWSARVCPAGTSFAALTLDSTVDLGAVTISRADGRQHRLAGSHKPEYRTLLLLGDEYAYDFTPAVEPLVLHMQDVSAGTALHVSLPWTAPSVFIYRDWWIDARSLLRPFSSLDALKRSGESGYFHDGSRLHLNLVEQRDRGYAQVEICAWAGC